MKGYTYGRMARRRPSSGFSDGRSWAQRTSPVSESIVRYGRSPKRTAARAQRKSKTRDDDGKFTYKNGGYSSSEGIVIEGSVEKTDRIGRGKGGGIGDKIKDKARDIGSVLGNVLVTLLNPQTISAILSILAVKYTASELKEIEEALYNRAALNTEAVNTNQTVQAEKNEKQKMQNRADALYGNDEEYNKKYYPEKEMNSKDNSIGGSENGTNIQHTLKELGLENNEGIEYKIDGKTITAFKNNPNENIGVLKVPKNTGNPALEKWKEYARIENTERVKELNDLYLKHNALLEQFGVDNVKYSFIKTMEKFLGNEAVENLHMSKANSYLNTNYAKQHKIYNNYTEAPENLREYFKTKISEQIGENKLDKTKGILIDSDSKSAISLKNTLLNEKSFIDKLNKYDSAMKNGYIINDSIEFKNKNWHYALGNADIRDMHINENGNIELYITDVYDFNEGERSDLVRVGRDRQDKGEIIPYFILYRVIIQKWLINNGKNYAK